LKRLSQTNRGTTPAAFAKKRSERKDKKNYFLKSKGRKSRKKKLKKNQKEELKIEAFSIIKYQLTIVTCLMEA